LVQARITYKELALRARAIAALLKASGIAEQESVLLLYPTGLEYICGLLGCFFANAVAVPLYPPRKASSLPRVSAIALESGARAVLTLAAVQAKAGAELSELQWLTTDPDGAMREVPGGQWDVPSPSAHSLALLQYTSGSTADPKGAMVSHGNLVHN